MQKILSHFLLCRENKMIEYIYNSQTFFKKEKPAVGHFQSQFESCPTCINLSRTSLLLLSVEIRSPDRYAPPKSIPFYSMSSCHVNSSGDVFLDILVVSFINKKTSSNASVLRWNRLCNTRSNFLNKSLI